MSPQNGDHFCEEWFGVVGVTVCVAPTERFGVVGETVYVAPTQRFGVVGETVCSTY